MSTITTAESGDRYFQIERPDYLNIEGKSCSQPNCNHKAHSVWTWAPGHFDGYRCVCCLRAIWQETLQDAQESLAELPEDCHA